MYVYRKVEDELSVCLKTKTRSFIPKKKLKRWNFYMTWLRALEYSLPFKIASRNSWETTLKCFVTMPLWQSNNLGVILCHQNFLVTFLVTSFKKGTSSPPPSPTPPPFSGGAATKYFQTWSKKKHLMNIKLAFYWNKCQLYR